MTNRIRRFELAILRPLWLFMIVGDVVAVIHGRWWWAAACLAAIFYLGVVGAKLHPLQSAADLAKGPLENPVAQREVDAIPEEVNTWLLSLAITKVAMLVSALLAAWLVFEQGWKWYFVLPLAYMIMLILGAALKLAFHAVRQAVEDGA